MFKGRPSSHLPLREGPAGYVSHVCPERAGGDVELGREGLANDEIGESLGPKTGPPTGRPTRWEARFVQDAGAHAHGFRVTCRYG